MTKGKTLLGHLQPLLVDSLVTEHCSSGLTLTPENSIAGNIACQRTSFVRLMLVDLITSHSRAIPSMTGWSEDDWERMKKKRCPGSLLCWRLALPNHLSQKCFCPESRETLIALGCFCKVTMASVWGGEGGEGGEAEEGGAAIWVL